MSKKNLLTLEQYQVRTERKLKSIEKWKKNIYHCILPIIFLTLSFYMVMYENPFAEIGFAEYQELYNDLVDVDCLPEQIQDAAADGKITNFEHFWLGDIESFGTKTKLHRLLINGNQCQG